MNNTHSNYTVACNKLKNQKYSILTLIPVVLFNQFTFFSNLFYLAMAASQFIEPLKVGFLFSYIAPLAIVLAIVILKEALDDYYRYKRDKEDNSMEYR